jgi:hypothetical protein
MYITDSVGARFLCICFGKMKSDARPDQLIIFTRCPHEALPIKYRDLPSAARNQTGTFQPEGRHRPHGPCERRARHLCCVSRDLDKKPDVGTLGTEDGLHTRATLPADRCHLNDTAVRINRHHRDDTAVGEEYMVERTVSVHYDLIALAANAFKLRISCLRLEDGRASKS